jgi:hypothetical protein
MSCVKLILACNLARRLRGFNIIVHTDSAPATCGLARSVGAPKRGKRGDYELTAPDCSRCHVVELASGLLEIHVDRVSPRCSLLGHIFVDSWHHVAWVNGVLGLAGFVLGQLWLWLLGLAGLALTLINRLLLALAGR